MPAKTRSLCVHVMHAYSPFQKTLRQLPPLQIIFPKNGAIRSRKVVTRSRARATGKFPSLKMKRMLQWESINELHAFRLLEANPIVKSFREQPCEIRYMLDDEERRHYPDILVETSTEKELWEVKPAANAAQPKTVRRTELLTLALSDYGYRYRVILGEDLARRPRMTNIMILLRFGRRAVPDLIKEQVRQLSQRAGNLTWGAVIGGAIAPIDRSHICRMILDGDLFVDIEQPLSHSTVLRTTPRC